MWYLSNEKQTMYLSIVLGPMFAGKSSEILRRVRRAQVLGWEILLLTCAIDKRYSETGHEVMTHDKEHLDAHGVQVLKGVSDWKEYKSARVIVIEEAQFFPDLYDFVVKAVEEDGKDVLVVGLDGDSDRKPFGDMLRLVPLADEVQHLTALCKRCGDGTPALFSALVKGQKTEQICVGGEDRYEAMCRRHYLENRKVSTESPASI